MFSSIKKIFLDPTADWPRSVTDSVLGDLRLSEEATWWEGLITIEGKSIGFIIGGCGKPDSQLISHAREIVRTWPEFEKMVSEFISNQAQSVKHLVKFADEIAQLTIEEICLFWPKRPNDGMIYFKGPDQYRLWRCDYINRKPQSLGFDD